MIIRTDRRPGEDHRRGSGGRLGGKLLGVHMVGLGLRAALRRLPGGQLGRRPRTRVAAFISPPVADRAVRRVRPGPDRPVAARLTPARARVNTIASRVPAEEPDEGTAMADIVMPQLGEASPGNDHPLVPGGRRVRHRGRAAREVSTDKVDTEVPAPPAGAVGDPGPGGETVDVGTVLAVLGDGAGAAPAASRCTGRTAPAPAPRLPHRPRPQPRRRARPCGPAPARPRREERCYRLWSRRLIEENGWTWPPSLAPASAVESRAGSRRDRRRACVPAILQPCPRSPRQRRVSRPAPSSGPMRLAAVTRSKPLNEIRRMTGDPWSCRWHIPALITMVEVDYRRGRRRVPARRAVRCRDQEGFALHLPATVRVAGPWSTPV